MNEVRNKCATKKNQISKQLQLPIPITSSKLFRSPHLEYNVNSLPTLPLKLALVKGIRPLADT